MSLSLAVKYRPKTFEDVVEQDSVKIILQNQLRNNDIRHAYLFVGSAGCGKTTCARILANTINKGLGTPIEIDGASNNGVDYVRVINEEARGSSIDGSEYKIFIIDECHAFSNSAWQAMLKTIEEPPLKTIFIFCTTNPEKIPLTILSRVQRYNFKKISLKGLIKNIHSILEKEGITDYEDEAVEHIATLANGGMRDALTMLDMCLAYDNHLTNNVVNETLNLAYEIDLYSTIIALTEYNTEHIINVVEGVENDGVDLKKFIDQLLEFLLNYTKWKITNDMTLCNCPEYVEPFFQDLSLTTDVTNYLIDAILSIANNIKYAEDPKTIIECSLLIECDKIKELRGV